MYDFLITEKVNKPIIITGTVIFYLTTYLASHFISITIVNFIVNLLSIFIISCGFQSSIKKKALVSLTITIINATSDICAYILMPSIPDKEYINLSFIGTVLIIQICERIVRELLKNKESIKIFPANGTALIIIPICSLGIIYSSARENYGKLYTVVIAVCVLGINIVVFYLYRIVEESFSHHIQHMEMEQKIKAYSYELEVMTKSQSKVRSLRHDMHHHLIEIEGMAYNKEWKKLLQYLEEMRNAIDDSGEHVYTNNFEINSVLNYLLQKAHEKLKSVTINICIPEDFNPNMFKLNVVIGNLIENAIYASEFSKEKTFLFEMQLYKGMLFIKVKNSYEGELEKIGNEILTAKADKDMHGIGLKNVKRIVEETNGYIDISTEGKQFMVSVMLYENEL